MQSEDPMFYWLNDILWVDHPYTNIPDPPRKRRKAEDYYQNRTHRTGWLCPWESECMRTVFVVHISCVWFCVYECNDFLRTSRDCRLPTVLFLTIFCGCAILYECNYCIRTKRLVFQYVLQIRDFVYVSGVTSYEQAANRGFQAQNVLRAWDFHVFSTPVLCSCWLFRDYIVIWMWS